MESRTLKKEEAKTAPRDFELGCFFRLITLSSGVLGVKAIL